MISVVITGIGLATPLGKTLEDFEAALRNGQSAIEPTTFHLDTFEDVEFPVAAVRDFDADRDLNGFKIKAWDRASHLAVFAARKAAADAGLDGAQIGGVILGSSTTSVQTLDESYWRVLRGNGRLSPTTVARCMPNAPVSAVTIDLGVRGMSWAVASACSSANHALISAAAQILSGSVDTAIAGGVEACLTYNNLQAWNAMHVLTQDTCRPFCATRSGVVLGEGAALFVLEREDVARARGAHIYARLRGWGQSSDAMSMTKPDQSGIEAALQQALTHSGVAPTDLGYINAHGTGTDLNDVTEAAAIMAIMGKAAETIPVSSTKALHGHLLGAAGSIELAAVLCGMKGGFVPPNANMRSQDPDIGLRIPITAEPMQFDVAMTTSFAFGGHNSAIVVERA